VPPALHQAFSPQIFSNLKSSFSQSAQTLEAWRAATTGVAPPTRRKGVAPARARGNNRQLFLYDSSLIPFLFLTIISISGLFNGIHLLHRPVSPCWTTPQSQTTTPPCPTGNLMLSASRRTWRWPSASWKTSPKSSEENLPSAGRTLHRVGPTGQTPYQILVLTIVIEHSHNKPALRQTFESSSRVVEFFERVHRSVDLRKYRQPCIMSSIMRWI
jgi:hypothetical protein